MEKIVLSVGGSLLNPGKPDVEYIKKLAALLKRLKGKHHFGILCGGGQPARDWAGAVRSLGGNEFLADEAAIIATRTNAFLMVAALGEDAYPNVVFDFETAGVGAASDKIVVMGGTIPGFTTDADAALFAEKINAHKLVNLSNVDAIYDSDPKTNTGAKKLSTMSHQQLILLANTFDQRKAGTNFVFDNVACKIVARSKIETHFVNGHDLAQVEAAVSGSKHNGTVVK